MITDEEETMVTGIDKDTGMDPGIIKVIGMATDLVKVMEMATTEETEMVIPAEVVDTEEDN